MARPRTTTNTTLPLWSEPGLGIRLRAAGDRFPALQKQRDRLLLDVQRKKAAVERFATRAQAVARTALDKLGPLLKKQEAICAEIAALFDELLVPGRLPARARKEVAKVRRALEEQGVLDLGDAPWAPDEPASAPGAEAGPRSDHTELPPSGAAHRVAPAPQHGQAAGRDSLRALFRRLALSVHPDRAAHEDDRARRTEAMKQVTQAYEDGDLARLVELETAWGTGQNLPAGSDEEARCRELERVIRELRTQANELRRELRQLEHSTPLSLLETSSDDLATEAEAELRELEGLRDFVAAFRDGKVSLADFIRGPELGPDEEMDLDALAFDSLLEELVRRSRPATGRAKQGRRKR